MSGGLTGGDAEIAGEVRSLLGHLPDPENASANRDADVFEDPMRFDITRDPNPHLSFGFGAHFCLGAHLARLETRCTLEQLVNRVDALALAQPESYVWSSFIAGVKRLDLELELR